MQTGKQQERGCFHKSTANREARANWRADRQHVVHCEEEEEECGVCDGGLRCMYTLASKYEGNTKSQANLLSEKRTEGRKRQK
jgi:hypothetical protein